MWRFFLVPGLVLLVGPTRLAAVDHVALVRDARPLRVSGQVVVEAQDGGLLVLDRAGVLWAVTPEEKQSHTRDDQPFALYGKEPLAEQLLAELPAGFRVHSTVHYLVVYNTSTTYAQWCSALFERLYAGFTNYWQRRGFPIREPAGPLVALVFDGKESFAQYSRSELGDATGAIIGYYSLATNRITMYDLTGLDAASGGTRGSSTEYINRLLSRPEAERTVATIVHEATHQLAFNCGLQTRYADIPLWFNEGIAIYFESPDLQSSKGWRGIGNVNQVRLAEFRQFLRSRPADSLATLLATDDRFRNTRTAPPAYAEAWALCYFLLRRYPEKFQAYLRQLSEKKPLLYDSPEERITELQTIFGKDLRELDAEFIRFMATVR